MEDLTGKKLGPYEIISPLGEGGMAMVYRGYQAGVNREVAIKVLPQYFARDAQFAARFRREAQLLAQLQHPHILPVFDYGDSDGHTYLAMPLIRSGTLADWLNGQPLPYAQCRKFITQIGDALDYAHARGLIHRDVKPSNVLIDERGNCLLTDFGLARMVEGGERVTTSGAIMGTPAYMSPEQCMGRPLDGRADVYSLGVILYEMAVGRAPYEADTPILIVVKHIHDPLPAPGAVVPGFPRGLEAVILKSLAKKPEDRYQTAGALVEALNAALDEIERGGAPPPGKTDPARPPLTNPPGPDFTSGHPLRPGSGAGGRDADPSRDPARAERGTGQGPLGGAPRGPGGADPQGPVGERDAGTTDRSPVGMDAPRPPSLPPLGELGGRRPPGLTTCPRGGATRRAPSGRGVRVRHGRARTMEDWPPVRRQPLEVSGDLRGRMGDGLRLRAGRAVAAGQGLHPGDVVPGLYGFEGEGVRHGRTRRSGARLTPAGAGTSGRWSGSAS